MLDLLFEVLLVGCVHLGGNLERHPGARGDFDGTLHAFFGRDAAQKGKVVSRRWLEFVQVGGQPVIDRGAPVGPGQGLALGIRDGDERHVVKFFVERD